MSKHIELAKKLKALADRGIGGEKQNAETMLNQLMKKHNITIEEIEGEKIEMHFFKIDSKHHSLWFQIVKRTNDTIRCYGEFPKSKIKQFNLGGNYAIDSTTSEYIEIEAKYDFYRRLYESELDIFFSAFLDANDLLCDNKPEDLKKQYTKEEIEKMRRIQSLSNKITVGQFKKQLS